MSWWNFGEGGGYLGSELALFRIECPFCGEKGNFEIEHHVESKKPNGQKTLNFDTYKCGNCAKYILIFWSGTAGAFRDTGLHNYKMIPWPQQTNSAPEYWPKALQRTWIEAHKSLEGENYDAATIMARTAMQTALRDHGAKGKNIYEEIEYLGKSGKLPPLMVEWSHEVRELGGDATHPQPEDEGVAPHDANDMVRYLDYLTEYLYDLPKKIEDYRKRKTEQENEDTK